MKNSPFQLNSVARDHYITPTREGAGAVVSHEANSTSACGTPGTSHRQTSSILRIRQVEARIGLRRSSIYSRMSRSSKQFDSLFPRPVSLGSPTCQRRSAVGWFEHEIEAWLAQRSTARSGP